MNSQLDKVSPHNLFNKDLDRMVDAATGFVLYIISYVLFIMKQKQKK